MKTKVDKVSSELSRSFQKLGHVRLFGAGEQIFATNERAEFLPIVRLGKVKMVHNLGDGKEVIVGIFSKGEMFAVPPLFDGLEYPASAFAMERTELLILPRDHVLDLIRESHEFAFAIISWTCEMLREKTATIQNLARSSPEHRIAAVLLRLIGDAAELPAKIALRRQDIAEMSNLTTETTIRAAKRLSQMGLIDIVHGKIIVNDVAGLRRFVG